MPSCNAFQVRAKYKQKSQNQFCKIQQDPIQTQKFQIYNITKIQKKPPRKSEIVLTSPPRNLLVFQPQPQLRSDFIQDPSVNYLTFGALSTHSQLHHNPVVNCLTFDTLSTDSGKPLFSSSSSPRWMNDSLTEWMIKRLHHNPYLYQSKPQVVLEKNLNTNT